MDSLGGMAVFVQAGEVGSFVGAGRNLGISASAVSKSIARLEVKLGVRLFHRSTRSLTLTAEGAHVFCNGVGGSFRSWKRQGRSYARPPLCLRGLCG